MKNCKENYLNRTGTFYTQDIDISRNPGYRTYIRCTKPMYGGNVVLVKSNIQDSVVYVPMPSSFQA